MPQQKPMIYPRNEAEYKTVSFQIKVQTLKEIERLALQTCRTHSKTIARLPEYAIVHKEIVEQACK